MTDIEKIKQYLDWKAEREGRVIDTSPEAWAHERATEELAKRADHILAEGGATYGLQESLDEYNETKEALNVSN